MPKGGSPSPRPPGAPSVPEGFLADFVPRSYAKGQVLATPDHPSDQVFIVRSGRLRVYLTGGNRELSLAILEAGDVFSTHTPTYVRCLEACELWLIDTRRFARKLAQQPAISPVMMRVLGRILNNAISLVEDLAFRDVPARLARFLIRQAEQRGVAEADGLLLPLDLGTEDIACLLGTTRQSVSSLINQWQREGLLTRRGRRAVLIHDAQALVARSLTRD